jgi:hypothetical protein
MPVSILITSEIFYLTSCRVSIIIRASTGHCPFSGFHELPMRNIPAINMIAAPANMVPAVIACALPTKDD